MSNKVDTIEEQEIDGAIDDLLTSRLIIWNVDHNSFFHVINLLIEICKHHVEQAEQCAYIIHGKGRCQVKSGSYDDMKTMKDLLTDGGLSVTIE